MYEFNNLYIYKNRHTIKLMVKGRGIFPKMICIGIVASELSCVLNIPFTMKLLHSELRNKDKMTWNIKFKNLKDHDSVEREQQQSSAPE